LLLNTSPAQAQAATPIIYIVNFGDLTGEAVEVINNCCGGVWNRAIPHSDQATEPCPQRLAVCEHLRLEEKDNVYRIHNVHSKGSAHTKLMNKGQPYNDPARRSSELMTNLRSLLMCHDIGVHGGKGNEDSLEEYCQACGRHVVAPSVTDKRK
jgi:hypothetical protein